MFEIIFIFTLLFIGVLYIKINDLYYAQSYIYIFTKSDSENGLKYVLKYFS